MVKNFLFDEGPFLITARRDFPGALPAYDALRLPCVTPTGGQQRRNSLRFASFGPPTVSCVLAAARTCIRQAPPTSRGRGPATSAVLPARSATSATLENGNEKKVVEIIGHLFCVYQLIRCYSFTQRTASPCAPHLSLAFFEVTTLEAFAFAGASNSSLPGYQYPEFASHADAFQNITGVS